MPNFVAIQGDMIAPAPHTGGLITTDVEPTVTLGGIPVAVVAGGAGATPCSLIACPGPCHGPLFGPWTGSSTVSARFKKVHRLGDTRYPICNGITVMSGATAAIPRMLLVGGVPVSPTGY